MGAMRLRWCTPALRALAAFGLLLLTGCAPAATPSVAPAAPSAPTATPVPTLKVSLLIEVAPNDARWYRDVEVPKGSDAYELTALVTQGNMKATYYASFRSHFVEALLGVENKDPKYWLIFLWDEGARTWSPLPVGADLYSLKDGHVLAWALLGGAEGPKTPTATP